MFQLDWYDGVKQQAIKSLPVIIPYNIKKVEKVQYTFWAEHCLECAPPECFKPCQYYQKRFDGHCKRTEHGQQAVDIKDSILGHGTLFTFRPWAKIETYIYHKYMSVRDYRSEDMNYQNHVRTYRALGKLNVHHILNNAGYFFKTRAKCRTQALPSKTNMFLFELWSYNETPFQMMIEAADIDWKVIARSSVDIRPGFNSFCLDYKQIAPDKTNVVRFYPENSLEVTVLMIHAEFLVTSYEKKKPADKVKCVAWDLDRTLWAGILSESEEPDAMQLRPGVRELILELDKRGIIQTIVSKNDYELAWKQIKRLGLDEYFLYPAINWGQKSKNLNSIAQELNINIDTFVMIDDSAFEREEIGVNLPQVRVYDENIVEKLLALPEFQLPVTEEAQMRRKMYQIEAKRKQIQASYSGDYLNFIKSCGMVIELGDVNNAGSEGIIERCYELVSRTNQLNITGHKYTRDSFNKHLRNGDKKHFYFNCKDKYGDYGIVGYVSFSVQESNIVIDELSVSCRVAQKHVEYALLSWIARNCSPKGNIWVKFIKTGKNTPMYRTLVDIGCMESSDGMVLKCEDIETDDGIITVNKIPSLQ
ncbi:HAD-IIIC family phosphatase [Sporofaciens musculi]|uniref:HAD-IIIC family phosphatase n=1 Tax=Sporofaciens musculi TaxID=2681861 RepID=UPI002570A5F0|nr:HAD-IIIC family phosphatase [Sporofaciens musculi]